MSKNQSIKRARWLFEAIVAVSMESLEQRRLLTSCSLGTGIMTIMGDDGVGNRITISYNSGTGNVTVSDTAATVTNCNNRPNITQINAYGSGTSTSPTATTTGADKIDFSGLPTASIPTSIFGQDGDDTLVGGGAADTIFGGIDNDSLYGGEANDSVFGGDGNDIVMGGVGADSLFGGNDDDIVGAYGATNLEAGDDYLEGDGGNDSVNGGGNDDDVWGDSPNDTTWVVSGPRTGADPGRDSIYGGTEQDEIDYLGRGDDLYVNANDDVSVNGAVTDWAQIVSANQSSNVVTVTTSLNPNGLSIGDTVIVIGVVPEVFNGIYTVTGATSTTFTYSKTGSVGAAQHVGSYATTT
jgi:Ca2+-binding RTX toxin-like protein